MDYPDPCTGLFALSELEYMLTIFKAFAFSINTSKSIAMIAMMQFMDRIDCSFCRDWSNRPTTDSLLHTPNGLWILPLGTKIAYFGGDYDLLIEEMSQHYTHIVLQPRLLGTTTHALQNNPDIQIGSPEIQRHMERFQGLLTKMARRITTENKQRFLHIMVKTLEDAGQKKRKT